MNNYFSLDKLPLNKEAYIDNLYLKNNLRRRMLDLGFIRGSLIKPVFISVSGDPRAYEIRGVIIAIRKNDAKRIEIKIEK